jgi:hypothetical protein
MTSAWLLPDWQERWQRSASADGSRMRLCFLSFWPRSNVLTFRHGATGDLSATSLSYQQHHTLRPPHHSGITILEE